MEPWILFTLLAAAMQTIRTAAQKHLSGTVSAMAATLARYLLGLPFAVVYLYALLAAEQSVISWNGLLDARFLVYAALASLAQIAGTVCLVKVLGMRNFAVGTVLSKTEALMTAVLGAVVFGALLLPLAWLAILVGVAGVVVIGFPGTAQRIDLPGVSYGLLSGLGFALTSIWLREASLALPYEPMLSAAFILLVTVSLQSMVCLIWVVASDAQQLRLLWRQRWLVIFIGASSCVGSIGWYTAVSYQDAALVRALGQIELLFAMLVTTLVFRERIHYREGIGLLAIAASVLLLLLMF